MRIGAAMAGGGWMQLAERLNGDCRFIDRRGATWDGELLDTGAAGAAAEAPNGSAQAQRPLVSVVVPVLNEEESVGPLYAEIAEVMGEQAEPWELIIVDDGSTDRSVERLYAAVGSDPRVLVVEFSRRFGQTAALAAGFRCARGRYIVPIDADLQNDPRDVPRMIETLESPPGLDVVSGWRRNRQDRLLSRRFPSVLANKLISRMTWTTIHDFGCTLKVYRREVLEGLELYGEMHRFLPALCRWRGARVGEMVVNHRARRFGSSKYNLRRTIKVLLDLVTVKFLGDYLTKPLYFFGKLALASLAVSLASVAVAVLQRFGYLMPGGEALHLNRNVLVMFGMMLFLMAMMFIMLGVVSELLVRIYHESQGKTPYVIRRVGWPARRARMGLGGRPADAVLKPESVVGAADLGD
jgi:glycosyltransferase involved in cell wall biosynthesis